LQGYSRGNSKHKIPGIFWKLLVAIVIVAVATLFALSASGPGQSVVGCAEGCAAPVERRAGPLRIVSLNMLHGFPLFKNLALRLDLIAAELKRMDADIVLLQETPWTVRTGYGAEYLAKQLGYNYLYYRANGDHALIFFEEGEAILSRFPLKDPIFIELKPRVGWFESRVSLGTTTITAWGGVTVFVTHLTDKDPVVRAGQMESLSNFVEKNKGEITLVAGDFNSDETSPAIAELAHLWLDTYRISHPADPGLTCCIDNLANGPNEPLEERIDYIFLLPGGGKLVDFESVFDQPFPVASGWQWASDHTGLVAEIEP
jgi:endonuclease/exonuclease/phosphatase family metal-dependent hydrolase